MSSLKDNGNKSVVARRFNDMIGDALFESSPTQKKQLTMLKAYMAKHKWASLGNVESIIKEVYASKLSEIEKLMDKM